MLLLELLDVVPILGVRSTKVNQPRPNYRARRKPRTAALKLAAAREFAVGADATLELAFEHITSVLDQ